MSRLMGQTDPVAPPTRHEAADPAPAVPEDEPVTMTREELKRMAETIVLDTAARLAETYPTRPEMIALSDQLTDSLSANALEAKIEEYLSSLPGAGDFLRTNSGSYYWDHPLSQAGGGLSAKGTKAKFKVVALMDYDGPLEPWWDWVRAHL